jgi:hypothetical protein
MSYSSRDRDRGRLTVAAVTGVGAVGALTATGWLMGSAASDFAAQQAAAADANDPTTTQAAPAGSSETGQRPRGGAGLRQRPYVTRVTLHYITAAGSTSAAPGPGGTLSRSSGSSGPSSSSGSSGPGPAQVPASAPAPVPAPPAPSSGS